MSNSDSPNMWKVIQSLNGTPDAKYPNEAISNNGQTITDIKSKVNVFINPYARVSKLNMSPANGELNEIFKKGFNAPSVDDESCAPLHMGKLQSAIKKTKSKEQAGPDHIATLFFKSPGPLTLHPLAPRIWRVSTIILLLKAGKSSCKVASFRPISLTSCVVKLLEPILADCLYYVVETNNLFTRFQAGFHEGRSCED